ncbi:hypothetical protein cypCar_00023360 [Cyprinus carpio]|nr:hypothetical protein cypCar_00023360 [Cyprinus carpio]
MFSLFGTKWTVRLFCAVLGFSRTERLARNIMDDLGDQYHDHRGAVCREAISSALTCWTVSKSCAEAPTRPFPCGVDAIWLKSYQNEQSAQVLHIEGVENLSVLSEKNILIVEVRLLSVWINSLSQSL